jgi:P27 family predicted phage terminase small subunit
MSASVGRPAKPAELHLLHGDPSKLGKGKLAALLDEAVRPPVEIPDAPSVLSKDALEEWNRIAPHLAKLGLISQIDRAALAAYCTAWGDYVWAERRIGDLNKEAKKTGDKTGERGRIWDTPSGYKQMSVPLQIRNRALEMMAKFLNEFGMSPAARSRVTPSDPAGQATLPGFDKPQEGGWGQFKPTT